MDHDSVINDQAWVLNIDMNGDTVWTATVGDTLTHRRGHDIYATGDGFVVCGIYRPEETQRWQAYWFKLDLNGNLLWETSMTEVRVISLTV